MGFGLVFLGYLSLFFFRIIPIDIPGFAVMAVGFYKLSIQNKFFKYDFFLSCLMFLYAVFSGVIQILGIAGIPVNFASGDFFVTADNIIYHSGLFALHVLMYFGIFKMSEQIGFDKGKSKSRYACISAFIYTIAAVTDAIMPQKLVFLYIPATVFGIAWYVYSACLIYSCYMNIATEEMLLKEKKKLERPDFLKPREKRK